MLKLLPYQLPGSKALLGLTISMLAACSGSGGSDMTSGRGGVANSKLTLSITDAAVDSASEVWVEFTGVTLHLGSDSSSNSEIVFNFNSPKRINLLSLQGVNATELIDEAIIPAGNYEWVRLHVTAELDGVYDSTIVLDDGSEYELYIPSGYQTGLKLNKGFTLRPNAEFNYTIDFDLRKSVIYNTDYYLRPTLRLVNNATTATIIGTVNNSLLLTDLSNSCSDDLPDTGNSVYIFEQHDIAPDDIDGIGVEPVTSASVEMDLDGNYTYTLGFIPEGDYTIAFTCNADLDTPDNNELIEFRSVFNVTVNAGETKNINFN